MLDSRRKITLSYLFESLLQLITPDGIQASDWELFQGAIFGRDSERVALDLLPWLEPLSSRIIFSLARLQGSEINPVSEEEPGRIHHEYRHLFVGGRKVGARQQEILTELSGLWGGTEKEVIYYGSVDATPQFIRLVAAHCRYHGNSILMEEFIHRKGEIRRIRDSVLVAVRWLTTRLEASPLGFLEFQRSNPIGLKWQVMRDGGLSYLHENGTLANADGPIASLEVQALAHDALLDASELFHKELPEQAAAWQALAGSIRQAIFQRFWMPEESRFAMAIDRDDQGSPRLIKTASSVPAELLESRIFDSLSEEDKETYVGSIVRQMYSSEFLTEIGIRSRALRYHGLVPHWDYQGSKVSWVVMTNIFTLGLWRQGFCSLAEDMENRMLNGASVAGALLEFYYVDTDGRINYLPSESAPLSGKPEVQIMKIPGTNIPENTQAWTVSALLAILLRRERGHSFNTLLPSSYWQQKIETEIFASTPKTSWLQDDEQLLRLATENHVYQIDRTAGALLEREFINTLEKDLSTDSRAKKQ